MQHSRLPFRWAGPRGPIDCLRGICALCCWLACGFAAGDEWFYSPRAEAPFDLSPSGNEFAVERAAVRRSNYEPTAFGSGLAPADNDSPEVAFPSLPPVFADEPISSPTPDYGDWERAATFEDSEPEDAELLRLVDVYCPPLPDDYAWSRFDEDRSLCGFFLHDFLVGIPVAWDDTVGLFRTRNLLFLGTGLAISLGLREGVDDDVRAWTARHPKRWGDGSEILSLIGNTEIQVAFLLAMYGWSYYQEDEELLEFSRLMSRSMTVAGLSAVAIKLIAQTERPSDSWFGGKYGFPSGHTTTSFALAATIEEYYGPQYGIPAYMLAGLIGWSRIDQRDHDLSDVVFGMFLGYAIGKSISGRELRGDSRIEFFPWVNPEDGSAGVMGEWRY